VRPITDITSTALGKEENGGMSVGYVEAMWHVDLLLDNNCERSKYTSAITK
jgi:hypothetical protein